MAQRTRLHLVPPFDLPVDLPAVGEGPTRGDVGLVVFLLVVNLIPIGGTLAGGHWSDGSVGFGTAASLFCIRELAHALRARRMRPLR